MPSTFFVQWNSEAHFNSKGFGCAFFTPHSHSGAEFEGSSGFDLFNVYGNNPQLPASIFWLKSEHFWPNPEISRQKTATYASTQQQTNYREIQLTITESVLRTCPKTGNMHLQRSAIHTYEGPHFGFSVPMSVRVFVICYSIVCHSKSHVGGGISQRIQLYRFEF